MKIAAKLNKNQNENSKPNENAVFENGHLTELAGLLHAAKLYVIQQAVKETQQEVEAIDNFDSTPASTSSVRTPILQKFTFLAAKMTNSYVGNMQGPSPQEQLDKYMTELQTYGGTNGKQFWIDHQAVYHILAPQALDLLPAPASEAYIEHVFSLCGMLTAGGRNQQKKNVCLPEAEQYLKLNAVTASPKFAL